MRIARRLANGVRDPVGFGIRAWAKLRAMVARKPGGAAYRFSSNVPRLAAPEGPWVFTSNVCRESHYRLPLYQYWCERLKEAPRYHRKQWEWVYLAQVLHERGMLVPGVRGLGFGVGTEPLVALFASHGAEITATDMDADAAREAGWAVSAQHAGANLAALNGRGICETGRFGDAVRYRCVDMNAIPGDLADFDFCWSSCAYEHLGSIENGLAFVRNSMGVLRRGGIAVHTTEFNLSSNERTAKTGPTVLFRRRDFQALEAALTADGHRVAPFDFETGHESVERYVDLPPFTQEPHLRLRLAFGSGIYDTTSIGIVVVKG